MHVKAQTIPNLYRPLVWGLSAFIICLCLVYIALVGKTAFYAVSQKEAAVALASSISDLSSLEMAYLRHTDRITEAYAASLGFRVDAPARYVSRASLERSLTFNAR